MQKANKSGYFLLDAVVALGSIVAISAISWGLLGLGKVCSERVYINGQVAQLQIDSIQLALDSDIKESKVLFCFNGILEDSGEFSTQGIIRIDGLDSVSANTPQLFLAEWQKKNPSIRLRSEPNASCLIVVGSEFKLLGYYKIQFNAKNECSLERWTPFNNQLICAHQSIQRPKGKHALRPRFEWIKSGKIMALLPSVLLSNVQKRGFEINAIRL